MTIDYPNTAGIGRFESKRFVPEEWRPRVPNPAYVRSRPDDTFWAARKLMAMSDDLIRAAVQRRQVLRSRARSSSWPTRSSSGATRSAARSWSR